MFQMRKKKVQRLKHQKLITITTCAFIKCCSKIQVLVGKKKKKKAQQASYFLLSKMFVGSKIYSLWKLCKGNYMVFVGKKSHLCRQSWDTFFV